MNLERLTWLVSIATCALALVLPSVASANDYCVDTSCGGTHTASLEDAIDLADDNVNPDRIFLGPSVYTATTKSAFTYSSVGPVEIIGDGRGRTILTGPAANSWVVYLTGGAGSSIHDLSIRLPAGAAQDAAALETVNTARRVDVISAPQQLEDLTGVVLWEGGTLEDSSVDVGGWNSTGLKFFNNGGTVRNSTIRAQTGVVSFYGKAAIERSRVIASDDGLRANARLTTISNSLIRLTGVQNGTGIRADTTAGSGVDTKVKADGVTIVLPDNPGYGGASASTFNAPGLNAGVELTNSLIRGGGTPLSAYALGFGGATVAAGYSDYDPTGNKHLGASASIAESNASNVGDAGFANAANGDYRLLSTSQLLDRGDPATAQGLDLGGNPLVADGDGDGVARRDLGAFELQPVPTAAEGQPGGDEPGAGEPGGGGPAVDAQAPVITGFRAAPSVFTVARARTPVAAQVPRGTRLRYSLSEPARLTLTIKRLRQGRYRNVARLVRSGVTGANRIRFTGRVGRRVLRPGRYRAVMTATDAAGNRSSARTIRLRVARVRP